MQDLKHIWTMAVDEIEQEVSPGLYHMLRDGFELASVNEKQVIIRTESEFSLGLVRRKASRALKSAFIGILDREVNVTFTVDKLDAVPVSSGSDFVEPHRVNDGDELAILHERYGDIMGIVDNHPLFCKASAPVDKGGWGIFPQLLTIACKEYTVMTVLTTLRFTAGKRSVRNPRAFFFKVLHNEQFGKKLTVNAH